MSLHRRLTNFLLTYRNTPHASTGRSPSQLFFQRSLCTHLELLKPDVERQVLASQTAQGKGHDLREKAGEF